MLCRGWARAGRTPKVVLVAVAFALFIYYQRHSATNNGWLETDVDFGSEEQVDPQSKPALAQQHYRSEGLLHANLHGPHPILELIDQAERNWRDKLYRASSSLDEAVQEYRRRYHRDPPKGFDAWWDYVQLRDVQLPDEYDQIHRDLEPFWGINPAQLREIQSKLEGKVDSYTIGKDENSPVSVVAHSIRAEKYDALIRGSNAIVSLLREVEEFLPPFRAVFSPDDRPNLLSDYAVKEVALDAARSHMYVGRNSLPKPSYRGWASACGPDSALSKLYPFNLDLPPPSKPNRTFIHDHQLAMDPCLHPELLWYHGQFLSHNNGPMPQREMVPEFSYCSTSIHHNIRIPTPYAWVEDIRRSDDPEWDDKLDERLLWRGSNTGIFHSDKTRWTTSQRIHLVQLAHDLNGTVDILQSAPSRQEPEANIRTFRKAHVNPALFDITFAGVPISCDPPTCKRLQAILPFRQKLQSIKEAGNYKYVIDVDGNGWSGRFKRLITSNSLVFKSTIYPEWYMDRTAPWVHYVPIQVDLSDLYDILVFFRGDANGEGAHDDLARKIASEGRKWSKTFWRREDMVAYMFRLILEYARVMNLDRDALTFNGDGIQD